jgi:hypothetical protein
MKKIDEYIRLNPDLFDTEEPDPGHVDRFRDRIHTMNIAKRRKAGFILLRVAAILIFGLLLSYAAVREFGLIEIRLNNLAGDFPNPELNEAVQYYSGQLSIYYGKIQQLRFNNDQAEKDQVMNELSAMDTQVRALMHDLKQNPDDERIVHAIINFYQVKIELMDVIIAHAEKTNYSIL